MQGFSQTFPVLLPCTRANWRCGMGPVNRRLGRVRVLQRWTEGPPKIADLQAFSAETRCRRQTPPWRLSDDLWSVNVFRTRTLVMSMLARTYGENCIKFNGTLWHYVLALCLQQRCFPAQGHQWARRRFPFICTHGVIVCWKTQLTPCRPP